MNCRKCGAQIENHEKFCSECGMPVSEMIADTVREEADINTVYSGGNIENEPSYYGSPKGNAYTPPDMAKKGRGVFITFSLLFAILTLGLLICEMVYFLKYCKPLSLKYTILSCVDFSIWFLMTGIIAVWSFTRSKVFSVIKGLCMAGWLAGTILLSGYDEIKLAFNILCSGSDIPLEMTYFVIMVLLTYFALYIFILLDIIRSIFSINKMVIVVTFAGYFTVLLGGVLSLVSVIVEANKLRFGFIPPVLYMITFILMTMFAGMARKRA